jgi:aryl-alcohol dehydrogenase-like predicted oxidoreductase
MNTRYLGRSGLKVSELCLGTMTFGGSTDEATSHAILETFGAAGGNFLDTADMYGRGRSEEVIGRWLKQKQRDQWIVATKVRFEMGPGPNQEGLSRHHILNSVENSLRRLQTDYIDLYQVHCWDTGTPLDETLSTLNGLVQSGKVRYLGISNYKAYQIQKAVDTCAARGWEGFISLQPLYNLLDRSLEWEIVELCQAEGLGILPWSPLREGWLSGKYRRGMQAAPEGTRLAKGESFAQGNTERTWAVIDELLALAAEIGKTPAQVALNWLKDRPGVVAPILGTRTLEQLQDNLGAVGWELSPEQARRLTEVSQQEGPYPYGEYHEWALRP